MQLEQLYHQKPVRKRKQSPSIAAHLAGSRQCEALGITSTGRTPVLALCRQLLEAGVDPDSALVVYRNGVLSLRIRSIREGAGLTVEDSASGTPKFRVARLAVQAKNRPDSPPACFRA